MCVLSLYLVAFIPWPGKRQRRGFGVLCRAGASRRQSNFRSHIRPRSAGTPRPQVSRVPLPPMCPPSPPGFVGLSDGAKLPGQAMSATSAVATGAAITLGEGTGQRWARTPELIAGGRSAAERLGRGKELVVKKAFRSDLGHLSRGQPSGFHSGDESVFPSPGCTAVQPRPRRGGAELRSPGVKRKVNPRGLAPNSALFSFSLQTWAGGARSPGTPRLGHSRSEGPPRRPRSAPSRPPQRSAPAGSCF